MMRHLPIAIGLATPPVLSSSSSFAAEEAKFGSEQEAKAMLEKAVVALKDDKAAALAMFNKGEGGFKDRDLYPFCFNLSDGKFVAAVKTLVASDVRALKDPTGKVFGPELYAAAQNSVGQVTEVSYMFPRPG